MKKVAIYNPYLDTLGGGERYTLAFAKVLSEHGFGVDLEWKEKDILDKLEKRFGMNLGKINVVNDIKRGDGYDLCFWVSDGSIPLLHARQNVLHFQVPFHGVNGKSLFNKMKLIRINKIVCNSKFTKEIIDKEFGTKSLVIYPPVDTNNFKPKHKENIILYVGRFSKILQSKRQDILISTFKKLCNEGLKDWKLVLAGGTEVGAVDFVTELVSSSVGYPIEIVRSPDFETLKNLYGRARIFWSAAGFDEDPSLHPERMEHFGITAVEAMGSGCVPFLYDGGGHKEIVDDKENGYLWNDVDDLANKTRSIVLGNKDFRNMEASAKKKAQEFSYASFEENVLSYILQDI